MQKAAPGKGAALMPKRNDQARRVSFGAALRFTTIAARIFPRCHGSATCAVSMLLAVSSTDFIQRLFFICIVSVSWSVDAGHPVMVHPSWKQCDGSMRHCFVQAGVKCIGGAICRPVAPLSAWHRKILMQNQYFGKLLRNNFAFRTVLFPRLCVQSLPGMPHSRPITGE